MSTEINTIVPDSELYAAMGTTQRGHADDVEQEIICAARRHPDGSTVAGRLIRRLIARTERAKKAEEKASQRFDTLVAMSSEMREQKYQIQHAENTIHQLRQNLEEEKASADILHAEVERLDPLQKVVADLRQELDTLRPLAEAEQKRRDKIAEKRAKKNAVAAKKRKQAKADTLYTECKRRWSLGVVEVMPEIHKALAKECGVTRAWDIVWAADKSAAPETNYKSAYGVTAGGTIVHNVHGYPGRFTYVNVVREIVVGKSWLRKNTKRLCNAAVGL